MDIKSDKPAERKISTRSIYGKTRKRVQSLNNDFTLTDQSQSADTDVNNIVRRYMKTRDNSIFKQRMGQYMDVASVPDFANAMNQVALGKSAFEALDSSLRTRFGNDPAEFMKFINNENNFDEAIRLGLMEEKNIPKSDASTLANPGQTKTKKSSKPAQMEIPDEAD